MQEFGTGGVRGPPIHGSEQSSLRDSETVLDGVAYRVGAQATCGVSDSLGMQRNLHHGCLSALVIIPLRSNRQAVRVEEALSPLQVALRAAAAVGRRQRSGVVPAVWSRWHTSTTTPGARDSTTRAARAMRRQPAFSGWPAQPRVSCSMDLRGCLTTPQDVSTDGDEQRSHCIARPSHAVAALHTAHVVVVRRLTACRVAPAAAQVDVLRSRWPPGVTRECAEATRHGSSRLTAPRSRGEPKRRKCLSSAGH